MGKRIKKKVSRKQKVSNNIGNEEKQDRKINLPIIIPILILIVGISAISFTIYIFNDERENLKSQIDTSLSMANSSLNSGDFEEAINEYEEILKIISPKKLGPV